MEYLIDPEEVTTSGACPKYSPCIRYCKMFFPICPPW